MDIKRLSHLPEKKRRELQRIARILFSKFDDSLKTKLSERAKRGCILKIIHCDSHARGNWLEDIKRVYPSHFPARLKSQRISRRSALASVSSRSAWYRYLRSISRCIAATRGWVYSIASAHSAYFVASSRS